MKTFTPPRDFSHSITGCYALNLLIKERSLFYNEPVYDNDPLKSVPAQDKKHEIESKAEHLKVFPNPAGNYFIVCYDLTEQQYPGILTISDINGRELKAFHLKAKKNQILIPTQDYAAGAYVIQLIGKNHLIESQKLTIIQ